MAKNRRILAVSTDTAQLEELARKCAQLAARYEAGVTLLYIKEERLFELPLFKESDGSVESVRERIVARLKDWGHEDWAVLAYDNDLIDHTKLEAKREGSFLVVSDEHKELDALVASLGIATLCLKKSQSHDYRKLLVALDATFGTPKGLDFALRFADGAKVQCVLDYQMMFVGMADPALDPVVGAMTPDMMILEENELIQAKREAFERLCKDRGIEGDFELGEKGLVEDTMGRLESSQADLLAIVAEERGTLLAEAAGELALKSSCDVLVCYNVEDF